MGNNFDEECKCAYEFLDSLSDEVLRHCINWNHKIHDCMDFIELEYDGNYRQFIEGKLEDTDVKIFNCINEEEFAYYIHNRLNINWHEEITLYFNYE